MSAVGRETARGVVEAGFEIEAEGACRQRHRHGPEGLPSGVEEQAVTSAFADGIGAVSKLS
jgi:hypothetical protein